MSGLIGKKIGMTSIFGANGKYVPCTVVEAGPCVVTQVKTKEKDGYEALQLAFDEKKEKKIDTKDRDKRFLYTEIDLSSIFGIPANEKKPQK